jgi:hypothetical protein
MGTAHGADELGLRSHGLAGQAVSYCYTANMDALVESSLRHNQNNLIKNVSVCFTH